MSECRQHPCARERTVEGGTTLIAMEATMTTCTTITSPLGDLLLVGEETGDGITLTSLSMTGQKNAPTIRRGWREHGEPFTDVIRQLDAYFAHELTRFDIRFTGGGTDFQQRVWRALEEIPHGTTTTYGALAEQLGLPRDRIQALAAAIGANPLLLVRPCHRVIGADGSMRGYAAGVERKVHLLTHEGGLQPALI
jgi:methylated-DNA-[protein]-cysteine S-methyltransferase